MQQGEPQHGQVRVHGAGRPLAFCYLGSDILSSCKIIGNFIPPFDFQGCAVPFLHHGSKRHAHRSGLKPSGVPVLGLKGRHETADWCEGKNL